MAASYCWPPLRKPKRATRSSRCRAATLSPLTDRQKRNLLHCGIRRRAARQARPIARGDAIRGVPRVESAQLHTAICVVAKSATPWRAGASQGGGAGPRGRPCSSHAAAPPIAWHWAPGPPRRGPSVGVLMWWVATRPTRPTSPQRAGRSLYLGVNSHRNCVRLTRLTRASNWFDSLARPIRSNLPQCFTACFTAGAMRRIDSPCSKTRRR